MSGVTCPRCKGSGKTGMVGYVCTMCRGKSTLSKCGKCHGSGTVGGFLTGRRCDVCRGTGAR